jgi:GPH family glycoside/pentoside/hexuronide:cation symporter
MAALRATLPIWKSLVYASGDIGLSTTGILRQIFFAIFLTDVVGLDPRLGSFAALLGVAWDAVNDPLAGMLSDRVRTRWGRRRPFLLFFAIPFGFSFTLLWFSPPFESQSALLMYVMLAFMLADTLSTLVSMPFNALMPEIAPGYDERTSLMGIRSFFQLGASLVTVIAAPALVDAALAAGLSQQQGYLLTAMIFGLLGSLPFIVIFLVIRETADADETRTLPIGQSLQTAWRNKPFRFATGFQMFNWSAVDMIGLILPFYLLYWVAEGDMLKTVTVHGISLSLESAFLGLLMASSILFIPFWSWLAHRSNKRAAYLSGLVFWILIEILLLAVQPGQVWLALLLGALAGIGLSSAYVLPDSIFADVIEWDELRTRRRQEGVYYGARAFIRKLTGALTIFFALQLLGWAGYQTPPDGATSFMQPEEVLAAIRFLIAPFGALLLFGAVVMAWLYPLTRERHAKIVRLLEMRRRDRFGNESMDPGHEFD